MSILNYSHVRALVQFKESREIVDVGGQINGGSAVAASVKVSASSNVAPGVSTMDAGYGLDMLHAMLATEEDVWIRVIPTSSLPDVLLVDAIREHELDPSMGQSHRYGIGFMPTASRITGSWTRVRGKMRAPLIFPATSRYTHGLKQDDNIYPIGGYVADDDSDYARWTVILEATSSEPCAIAEVSWSKFHCELASALQAAGDNAETVTLELPAFPRPTHSPAGEDGNQGLMALNAPSNCTNAVMKCRALSVACTDPLYTASMSEEDAHSGEYELSNEMLGCMHWKGMLSVETKNINGFEQGEVPALTNLEWRF